MATLVVPQPARPNRTASQSSLRGAEEPSLRGAEKPNLRGAEKPNLRGAEEPNLRGALQREDSNVDFGVEDEDEDFLVLQTMRENRRDEPDEPLPNPNLGHLPEAPLGGGASIPPTGAPGAPQIGGPRVRTPQNTVPGSMWQRLTAATVKTPSEFKDAVTDVKSVSSLVHPGCLEPSTGQNILNYVIEKANWPALEVLLEMVDGPTVWHTFTVHVRRQSGVKHSLHQAVEAKNLELLKTLLSKVTHDVYRKKALDTETPVQIQQGQRTYPLTCLHLAAMQGLTATLVYLVEDRDVDVDQLNTNRDTALMWAARSGHRDTVSTLLRLGANPRRRNADSCTAFYWAVRYGSTETVDLLARDGRVDINVRRTAGLGMPIIVAAALGTRDTMDILLKSGANVNAQVRNGERPIHQAAREGHTHILWALLEAGASINVQDTLGDTPLLLAARHGRRAAVRLLLQAGADMTLRNKAGDDVWTLAISSSNNNAIIQILLSHQKLLDRERDRDLDNRLHISRAFNARLKPMLFRAAAEGNCETVQLFQNIGMDLKAKDAHGKNFLHYAAISNQTSVVQRFHAWGDVNHKNNAGNTPLHEACERGNNEVIKELIKIKAMANISNLKGETPLHVSAFCKTIEPATVAQLIQYIQQTHPLAGLDLKDNEENTALHIAAKHARPDVLWEFRFVSLNEPDAESNLPLHEAVRPGEPECLETMLNIYKEMGGEKGNINWQNRTRRETVLILAARRGFLDAVRRLVSSGADISLVNFEGNTVLHILTSLSVSDPAHCARYLEIIDVVLESASEWYCLTTTKMTYLGDIRFVRRRAVLKLVTETYNKADMSVLGLACRVGATEVLDKFYNLEEVFFFNLAKMNRYDVTFITPKTNDTLRDSGNNRISPNSRPSCLEWLLATGTDSPHSASKVLDIQPFKEVEGSYGHIATWAYAIIMALHIIYMSLHSWSGVTLLNKQRTDPGSRSADAATLVLYIVVPLEPTFMVLYNFSLIVKMCRAGVRSKMNARSSLVYTALAALSSLVHSFFVALWIGAYTENRGFMDSILAISLCIGWLYSLAFTRGLKMINYFWRLIQVMIVQDVSKFLVVYLFVLMAFAFAFHAQFQVSQAVVDEYPTPMNTLFMMFNMMLGMEYIFEEDNVVETGIEETGRSTVPIKIYFIFYMVMGTIVLLNLLIAMMNGSYQAILQRGTVMWRIESVKLGVDVEKSVPTSLQPFISSSVKKGYICRSDEEHQIQRWYIDIPNRESEAMAVGTAENEALAELRTKLENLDTRMSEQLQVIKNLIENPKVSQQGGAKKVIQPRGARRN